LVASEAGAPVPDPDHALRYIGKKHVDKGTNQVNGSGFLARPGEDAPSANWIECFEGPIENQLSEIRERKRFKYEKRGRLVRLNVGNTRQHIVSNAPFSINFAFLHDPLPAEDDRPEDPSHALMHGAPELDTPEGEMIQDLFLDCILESFEVLAD
jgi:hypothetical protein